MITQQSRQKQYHDYHARERTFVVDDNVLVKNFTSNCPKWLSRGVVAVKGSVSYKIELMDGNVVRRHLDHIRSGIPSQSSGGKGENHDHDFDISPTFDLTIEEQFDGNTVADKENQSRRLQRIIWPPLRYRD